MKILLTNDDGIDSPGLSALEEKLSARHEVVVVAPSEERSGYSNSLTFHRNIRIRKIDSTHYSCSGTPADCVHRTLHRILDGFYPDIVVSGINIGPNLGTDIIYSGTAAAARQAAIMGVPGVAVSVTSFRQPFYFENAATFVLENIGHFHAGWNGDHFVNINVPSRPENKFGVMVTVPSKRFYNEKLGHSVLAESDHIDISLDIIGISHDEKYGTDCYAVENGMISVSPVLIQPVADSISEKAYRNTFDRTGHGQ